MQGIRMAYVPRRRNKILVIDEDMQELVDTHAAGLRELLVLNKVPESEWNAIWHSLEKGDDPLWKEADGDLDIQWLVGWMKGVAEVLGTTERKLVQL